MIRRYLSVGAVLALVFGAAGTALAGGGQAVAFASVDGLSNPTSPTIRAFGGSSTKSATVSLNNPGTPGEVVVAFVGKFPKSITVNDVIPIATAESNDFGVANAYVVSVSKTEIDVDVATWVSSNTATETAENLFVTLYLGH
jgi:hypothetical protein